MTSRAADFFRGIYTTALEPGELVTEVVIPRAARRWRSGFQELARRHGDFALAGLAARARRGAATPSRHVIASGLFWRGRAAGARPPRRGGAGRAAPRPARCGGGRALDGDLDPPGDVHGSPALRRHLARVLLRAWSRPARGAARVKIAPDRQRHAVRARGRAAAEPRRLPPRGARLHRLARGVRARRVRGVHRARRRRARPRLPDAGRPGRRLSRGDHRGRGRHAATIAALQRAFREENALQCGFCTPGMLLTAHELLEREPRPDDAAIREAIAANYCRCTAITPSCRRSAARPSGGPAATAAGRLRRPRRRLHRALGGAAADGAAGRRPRHLHRRRTAARACPRRLRPLAARPRAHRRHRHARRRPRSRAWWPWSPAARWPRSASRG